MIINLNKKQTGLDFIKEMEKSHGSINQLEKMFKKTNNMVYYVDLEAWKYHLSHLDEEIDRTTSIVTDKITITEADINLLNTIKKEKPKSIRELARLTNKDVSTVHSKIKNLQKEGLIELIKGDRNRKIPVLKYDEISIAI
jgi:DNA-binding MarR family transcriptional regulator